MADDEQAVQAKIDAAWAKFDAADPSEPDDESDLAEPPTGIEARMFFGGGAGGGKNWRMRQEAKRHGAVTAGTPEGATTTTARPADARAAEVSTARAGRREAAKTR